MIAVLAIGGSLGRKKTGAGHRRAPSPPPPPLFGGLLVGVVIIVVGLTYFPVVALGPVVEHLVGHFRRSRAHVRHPVRRRATRPPAPRPARPRCGPSRATSLFEPTIVRRAVARRASSSSTPASRLRNPVMFVVLVGSVWTTVLFFRDLPPPASDSVFVGLVAVWLWFTVLFANFAEAVAEGRGKAQADTLRKTRSETVAHVRQRRRHDRRGARPTQLQIGDLCVVAPGS